jgi:tetratricopeptide (TPR) repeat protein
VTRLALALLLAVWALVGAGCATYSDRMHAATSAVDAGSYASGLEALNKALRVDSEAELPERWKSNDPLTVLERGIVLQSLGRYEASSHDLQAAEQEIELLDLRVDAVGALGKYLYSDATAKYKAPPSERLALNAINLLNYLARGDLDGAAVEARRFQTQREFLVNNGIDAPGPASLGAYLAGIVFEKLGEGDRALRYYEEALAGSGDLASLHEPIARLAKSHPYRGPRLEQVLAETGAPPTLDPKQGEILVVTSVGRVPRKVPERMPIGAAIGYVGTIVTGDLSVLERSAFKVLVFPSLRPVGSQLSSVAVAVDGANAPLELITDLGAAVTAEYEANKPQIIAAGLTRLLARAAIAEGARAAGNEGSNVLGIFAALATEAVLVAADRPDTRSWTLLPGRVLATRIPVRPGDHVVEVAFGRTGTPPRLFDVTVAPGGFSTIVVTEPR